MLTISQERQIKYTTQEYSKRRAQTLHLAVPSEPHTIRFWKIEEAVGGGLYITLPGIYICKSGAVKEFPKRGGNFRAMEYEQGHDTAGPQRVEGAK